MAAKIQQRKTQYKTTYRVICPECHMKTRTTEDRADMEELRDRHNYQIHDTK